MAENENKLKNFIFLLYGEDTFLLEEDLKKITKSFGEKIPGINYIKIDQANIDKLIPEMETPAFGYEKKLIIVRDSGLFKMDGRKKVQANSEIVKRIDDYINENLKLLKESIVLIFIEKDVGKNELYKTIEKKGFLNNYEELKPNQIATKIKSICNAYKVNIDNYTISYFIECTGCNMKDIINELRKLIEYAGTNGTITKESIDLLCVKKIESVIFDLTDNLGKKNVAKALEVLNNLVYNKEPLQKILITLYNHFKKLYIVKLCTRFDENIAENLKLKPNQTFLVSKYKTQANYFKEQELRKIVEELINLDKNFKSGLIDLSIGLESIICRYCS